MEKLEDDPTSYIYLNYYYIKRKFLWNLCIDLLRNFGKTNQIQLLLEVK